MSTRTLGAPDTKYLTDFTAAPADPIVLLSGWFEQAQADGVREPDALAVATAGLDGRASSRIVRVLAITSGGLLFTTHDRSQKGRDIVATGWASGVLYWRETRQQITVAGPARRLADATSDDLWAARPASTHPMSVASQQSAPLTDEAELRAEASRLAQSGEPLARPAGWSGYELRPVSVEFWLEGRDRLHERLRYDLEDGRWTSQRLQP